MQLRRWLWIVNWIPYPICVWYEIWIGHKQFIKIEILGFTVYESRVYSSRRPPFRVRKRARR